MKRALLLLCLAACDDALDQRLAIIDAPRVLAVTGEPAEAKPGAMVRYQLVLASPEGPVTADASWAYCLASKPPTEDNAVSSACLDAAQLAALGTVPAVTGMLPADACIRFGPDTPGTGFRPRDPDATGGYYQPVRADVGADIAFGLSRITCKLPTAPGDLARRYELEYVANANPMLDEVAPLEVAADRDVTLTASWPAQAAETYLWFDPLAQRLVDRHEAMRLSWFASGGRLAVDASAIAEDSAATSVSTTWHTPAAGTAWLWFVLRDSRGGIAARVVPVDVR